MNFLQNTIIRIPKMPFRGVLEIYKNAENLEFLKTQFNIPIIHEAIYLASPELYQELQKMFDIGVQNKALIQSFLKYLLRMHVRCTPYGLFAGCGVASLSSVTQLDFSKTLWTRNTQLDYHYINGFLEHLSQKTHIKEELLLQINETVFEFGTYFRFIQYQYQDHKRQYSIVALKKTSLLKWLQFNLKKPKKYKDIVSLIATDSSEILETQEFLDNYLKIIGLSIA